MLHAIENSKIGRAIEHDLHWRELFNGTEDTLTSFIFERLFYLPVKIFWNILKASCSCRNLPQFCNSIVEINFWPRWETETDRKSYVEPDIFIRFAEFDLIIEAKRHDNYGQQKKRQWADQINRYHELFPEDKLLLYIAIGGNKSMESEMIKKTHICKAKWSKLLCAINKELDKLKKEEHSPEIKNILKDLIIALRIHGYVQGTWIKEDSNLNIPIDYNKSCSMFSNFFQFNY